MASGNTVTYQIAAPDGNTYRISGPQGATQDQVREEVLRQHPTAGTPPSYGQRVAKAGDKFDKAAGTGLGGLANTVGAAVDTVAHMATSVAGDVAGAVASTVTQNPARGEAVRQKVSDVGAPTTASGKAGEAYIGTVLQPIGDTLSKLEPDALKHFFQNHPILAQNAKAALDVVGTEEGVGAVKTAGKAVEALKKAAPASTAAKVADLAGTEAAFKTAKDASAARVKTAYDNLEKEFPGGSDVPLTNTHKTLNQLQQGIDTGFQAKAEGITRKLSVNGQPLGSATASSIKELRTEIGDHINWQHMDASDRQLKKVYDALSKDMEAAATAKSPEAAQAWKDANAAHTANLALNKAGTYRALYNPEKVGTVQRTVAQMGPNASAFTDEVVRRMGFKNGEFNADQFVKNYGRMPEQMRSTVFGTKGVGYQRDLNALIGNVERIEKGKTALKTAAYGHYVSLGIWDFLLNRIHPGLGTAAVGGAVLVKGANLAKNLPEIGAAAREAALLNPKTVKALLVASKGLLATGRATGAAAALTTSLTQAPNAQQLQNH